jgi:hypothetical protein
MPDRSALTPGHFTEQQVTGSMTMAVVERLEVVEVEKRQRTARPLRGRFLTSAARCRASCWPRTN